MFTLFQSHQIREYKIALTKELLEINNHRAALKEAYIPLRLLKYDQLLPDWEKECKRMLYFPEQLLNGEKLWLIGAAEMGKTTLFHKLALDLATDAKSDKIPLYIDLKNLARDKQNIYEYIVDAFAKNGYPEKQKFIKSALIKGSVVFLLDGLDEISDSTVLQVTLETINHFLDEYGQYANTLFIACRDNRYCSVLNGLGKAFLHLFNEREIEELVQARLSWPVNSQQFLEELNRTIQIKQLIRTPLAFTYCCYLYRNDKSLPANRAELYQMFVQQALEDSPNPVGRNDYSLQQRLNILEELAFYCHNQRQIYLTKTDLRELCVKVFAPLKIKPDDLINLLMETFFVAGLIRTGADGQSYRFTHLSLQEFFCAGKIAVKPEGIKFALGKHSDNWWHKCITFYAGILNNPSGLIISLKEVNTELAYKCYLEAKQVYPDLQKLLQTTVRQNLENKQENKSYADILYQVLVSKADAETIEFVRQKMLTGTDSGLKVRAAQALCEIGNDLCLKILEEGLKTADSETKRCIISAFDHLWRNRQPLPGSLMDEQLLDIAKSQLHFIKGRGKIG